MKPEKGMTVFTRKARERGWMGRELAERWEMTLRNYYHIARHPRMKHWDMLAGVPVKAWAGQGTRDDSCYNHDYNHPNLPDLPRQA